MYWRLSVKKSGSLFSSIDLIEKERELIFLKSHDLEILNLVRRYDEHVNFFSRWKKRRRASSSCWGQRAGKRFNKNKLFSQEF